VLFSTAPAGTNPLVEDHLARGGIVVRVEPAAAAATTGGAPAPAPADGAEMLVVRRGKLRIPIATVTEVPLLVGGAARFQLGNVLPAIATAYVQGMRYDDIRAGLLSFFPSPALTPGRLNLMRVRRGRVLVDYAHNPAAVAGLMDMVQRLPARRRLAVVAVPGDRRDEDAHEVGRLAASLDQVIVKEDDDLRDRPPGEMAGIIVDGLVAGGMARDRVEIVRSERAAVERLLALLDEHDIGVVLADDVPEVLRIVGAA
jgi:cyanophycin synthetase